MDAAQVSADGIANVAAGSIEGARRSVAPLSALLLAALFLRAIAWLANKLYEYGVELEPGHVLLSGSFIKAIPFQPGDSVVALFDTLGEVTFTAE